MHFMQICWFIKLSRHASISQKVKWCTRISGSAYLNVIWISIVISNGKIIWKHGSFCWHFCLNLEYLGWPCREYIKTAKRNNFKKWRLLWRIAQWKPLWGCFSHFLLLWLLSMVLMLLRQFRRSLQIKKSTTNAPRIWIHQNVPINQL